MELHHVQAGVLLLQTSTFARAVWLSLRKRHGESAFWFFASAVLIAPQVVCFLIKRGAL